MKLLVDANLSPKVADGLRRAGHDASHVADHGLLTATDEAIQLFAANDSAVIISADSDFATMLALTGATTPSLILLRSTDRLPPQEQCALILANFESFAADLTTGCIVSLSMDHLRVRPLPVVKSPRPPSV